MKLIEKEILERVGFGNVSPKDYFSKKGVLRDGREATIWVHKKTGHGILDEKFWEKQDYYVQNYRKEFSAKVSASTAPVEHLKIYKDLNKKQFETFSSHLGSKTKFLEVGCSFGGILSQASKKTTVCHGVEPSIEDAEFVSKNNKKAKIFNTTFEKADLPCGYYDIAVGIEVLEHAVSPKVFLKKCSDVLGKKGLIHLEVPNYDDVLFGTYKDPGYVNFYYHKAHIHYFTVKSFKLLCEECGFKGKVSSFLMYPFFNHVWWHQNHKPQPSAVSALATPVPAEGKTAAEKEINNFYKKTEDAYEKLINNNMLGDCLIFQGRKK